MELFLPLYWTLQNFLKNIFSKYEKEQIKERLKEIKESDISKKWNVARTLINNMDVLMVAMMVNASSVN